MRSSYMFTIFWVRGTRIQNVGLIQNFFSSSVHASYSSLFESQYYPAIHHASHRPAPSASILDTRLLTLTRRLTRLNPHVQMPPQRLLYHWNQVRSHLSEKQSHNASSRFRPCRFRAPDRRLGYWGQEQLPERFQTTLILPHRPPPKILPGRSHRANLNFILQRPIIHSISLFPNTDRKIYRPLRQLRQ